MKTALLALLITLFQLFTALITLAQPANPPGFPRTSKVLYLNGPSFSQPHMPQQVWSGGGTCGMDIYYNYWYYDGAAYWGGGPLPDLIITPNAVGVQVFNEGIHLNDPVLVSVDEYGSQVCEYQGFYEAQAVGSFTITVVNFNWNNTAAISEMCLNEGPIQLSDYLTYTSGVSYSGPGVVNGVFTPANAGVGTHDIVATRTFDNGSIGRILQIVVRELPNVAFNAPTAVCNDGVSYSLPSYVTNWATYGGSFSGNGVAGNFFIPNASGGVGSKTITYTSGANGYGCINTLQDNISVAADFSPSAGGAQSVCQGQSVNLSGASPASGSWSTSDCVGCISGNSFNAAGLNAGGYTVTYTVNQSGCVRAANKTVTVNALPAVEAGNNLAACSNGVAVDLTLGGVNPAGGSWSSPTGSVNSAINNGNSTLNPSGLAAGGYSLIYTVTANGCSNSDARTLTINAPPAVDAGSDQITCLNGGNIALTGNNPAGGAWSGSGVSGSTFNPVTAGTGNHVITYSYNNGTCGNSDTKTITVNTAGPIDAGTNFSVCFNSGNYALTGGSPAGGTWSGTSVSGSTFNSNTPPGAYVITYTVLSNGCIGNDTRTITVNALPSVEAGNNLITCTNTAAFNLTGASPSGGTWSGPGLSGPAQFTPALAGTGVHILTYTYTDNNNCTSSDTRSITVNAPTPVAIGGDQTFCTNSAVYNLNSDVNAAFLGGTWSGSGVNGNNFTASNVAPGAYTITYTYTNAQGCVSGQSKQFTVVPGPIVDAGSTSNICVNGGLFNLVGESPLGGTWSGFGVSGNQFNPAVTGTGIFVVTYSYSTVTCTVADTRQIVVSNFTSVDAGPNLSVCYNTPDFLLTGMSLNGGTWNGPGVAGGFFSPASAGVGVHVLTYTYTNNNGCQSSDTRQVTVHAAPVVDAGADIPLCSNSTLYNLIADVSPPGGSFTGSGVQLLNFNPALAGIGVHQINYSYTNPSTGCVQTDSRYITVLAPQAVTLGNNLTLCIDAPPFALTEESIPNGVYAGNGVSGNLFTPSFAGMGNHIITYTVADINNCQATGTRTLSVIALPIVEAGPDEFICSGSPLLSLNGTGSPAGGIFSGPFVSGGNFDVAASGAGNFEVTYTFTNANGCTNVDTRHVIVDAGATVSAGPDFSVCTGDPLVDLASRVSPGGGTFTGTGVNGTNFNPSVGPGSYSITYTLNNAYGCAGNDSFVITVNNLPSVNAGSTKTLCFNEPLYDLSLTAVPAGGSFFGPGVTGHSLDPSGAGVGSHTIYYTYTNANGCSSTATRTITVTDLPAVNAGANQFLCVNSNLVDLTPGTSPANGTWSGPGIINGIFHPALAGAGVHVARYTITQTNGCTHYDERTLTVFNPLTIDAGPDIQVCSNAPLVSLNNNASVPGTWSGTSVTASNFNPAVGAGSYVVTLSYTDFYGCSDTDSKTITVLTPQSVSVGSDLSLCVTASPLDLSASVAPIGGTFNGTGVINSSFTPALAGIGTHPISYQVTDVLGCTSTRIRTITVTPPPAIDAGINQVRCVSSGLLDLEATASITGGTWSGTAVTGSYFNPAAAGIGNYLMTYHYDNGQGCVSTDTKSITVRADLTVDAGPDQSLCVNGAPLDLSLHPSLLGGTWTGPGINGSAFLPASAGPGTHVLLYRYTDSFGCSAQDTKTMVVYDKPIVTAGSPVSLCTTAPSFNLASAAFPSGGSWTGAGVSGSFFHPQAVGAGQYQATYQVTNIHGCTHSASRILTVTLPPAIDTGPTTTLCLGSGLLDLDLSAGVSGGSWSSPAVSYNLFDPQLAGVGNHLVTYTYDDGQGCISTDTKTIVVRHNPVVYAGADLTLCINAASVDLSTRASLPGGHWSGLGVNQNTFQPSTAGLGLHPLTYTYTDPYGCVANDYVQVNVHALPLVDGGPALTVCTTASAVNLNQSSFPIGGTWTGAGVTGSSFDPSTLATGSYQLTHQFTNGEGCAGSDTKTVTVVLPSPLPVGGNVTVCENSPALDLSLTTDQPGGLWSGVGITGTYFVPALAGVGTHTLHYTRDDGQGCVSQGEKLIQVRPSLVVQAGNDLTRCVNATPYNLSGDASLPGGTWTGAGVAGTSFNPSLAGVGTHLLTYEIADAFGCRAQDTRHVLVTATTTIDAGPPASLCTTAPALSLTNAVSVPGGSFFGPGISGDTFSPALTGVGDFDITYTYTNADLCTTSDTRRITVNLPEPISVGGNQILCVNSARLDLDLSVSEVGGIWSGSSGLEGGFFNPALAGIGTHLVTYRYDNGVGCISTANKTIQVRSALTVDAGSDRTFCKNASLYNLANDASLIGGVWQGPGVSGNSFSAATAGPGTHVLTYRYEDDFGCQALDSRTFTVSEIVSVNAGPSIVVCADDEAMDLTSSGFPAGGTWSGQGTSGTFFDPSIVGPGNYLLTYVYAGASGCAGTDTKSITVASAPVVTAGGDFDVCVNAAPLALTGASPSQGTWSGPGVIAGVLDPLSAGLGTHTLAYSFTDANGCRSGDTLAVHVLPEPSLGIGPDHALCLNASPFNLLANATIKGGVFTGSGITGSIFNPAEAGAGPHVITYRLRFNGCELTAFRTITVNEAQPLSMGDNVTLCVASTPIDLVQDVNIIGGIFSGNGVDGSTFHPSLAGVGSHVITYTYVNAFGCTSQSFRVITVQEQLPVDGGTDLTICNTVDSFDLSGRGNPANGIYVGEGIQNNQFSPSRSGLGTFLAEYIVDNGNGCISRDEVHITVRPSSLQNFGGDSIVCITAKPIPLNFQADLMSGTWSGPGVVNNVFYPSLANAGTHLLGYQNQALDCDIAGSRTLTVVTLPKDAESSLKNVTACEGAFITLHAEVSEADRGRNVNVAWYQEGFTTPFDVGDEVSYQVKGSGKVYYQSVDQYGCASGQRDYVQVLTNNPSGRIGSNERLVAFGKPVLFFPEEVKNAERFEWNFGDGLTSLSREAWHYYYESGTFDITLALISADGCTTLVTAEDFVEVLPEAGRQDLVAGVNDGAKESITASLVSAHPNPFDQDLTIRIRSPHSGYYDITAVNAQGATQHVATLFLKRGDNEVTLATATLASGLYHFQLVGPGVTITFNAIKK
jgi:hypothetical protein